MMLLALFRFSVILTADDQAAPVPTLLPIPESGFRGALQTEAGFLVASSGRHIHIEYIDSHGIHACDIESMLQCALYHLRSISLSPQVRIQDYELQKAGVVPGIHGVGKEAYRHMLRSRGDIGMAAPLPGVPFQDICDGFLRDRIGNQIGAPQGMDSPVIDPALQILVIIFVTMPGSPGTNDNENLLEQVSF